MEKEELAVVLGGDLRQIYAAEHLADQGYMVYALGFRQGLPFEKAILTEDTTVLKQAQLALFPLSVSQEGKLNTPLYDGEFSLREILALLPKECQLFGGNVREEEQGLAGQFGLQFRDFFKVEELTVANALLTAEGAIMLAMEQLPLALWQSRCLIGGYGRIGRALHSRLKAFGAEVIVLARNPEQRIWAEVEGARAFSFTEAETVLSHQQLIFNTVPAQWLREGLSLVADECPIIELASKPYGMDFALAKQLGKKAILAAGLPGKYAPKTAGELIAKTILTMR